MEGFFFKNGEGSSYKVEGKGRSSREWERILLGQQQAENPDGRKAMLCECQGRVFSEGSAEPGPKHPRVGSSLHRSGR